MDRVEKIAPVAYSPLDVCKGRGSPKKHRLSLSGRKRLSQPAICDNYIIMDIYPSYIERK
jgi:hypothetical protein